MLAANVGSNEIGDDFAATPAPDGVTPTWLTTALRRGGVLHESSVTHLSSWPVGVGMLGESQRFKLTYDRDEAGAPATLVGKFPAAGEISRSTGVASGMFAREIAFYKRIAPTTDIRVPRCYYGEVSADGGVFTLLMEDLAPARQGDQLVGCSLADAEAALVQAAALHTPRWGDASLYDETVLELGASAALMEHFPSLTQKFINRYDGALSREDAEFLTAFSEKIAAFLSYRPRFLSLQHTDFRLDNMLFDINGGAEALAVVDWQTVTTGSGLFDIGYFIGSSLLTDVRRRHETQLIALYLERLAERGITVSLKAAMPDYRQGVLQGAFTAVAAALMTNRTPRGDQLFLSFAQRHCAQARDVDAMSILG